jgi:hypothetical protein
MSRSGSLFLASALALTASITGACGEPETDPGTEAAAATSQPGATQVIGGRVPPGTLLIGGERVDDVEIIGGLRPATQVIAGQQANQTLLIGGRAGDERAVIGGILRLHGAEVIGRQLPDANAAQVIDRQLPDANAAQVIGGLRPATESVLDPGFEIALPGDAQIIGGMLPRTATPVRMVPPVSGLRVGCVDGANELLVRLDVHGQVASAYVELHDGDRADGAMLDHVLGLPLVDHGHIVFDADYTVRYAFIPLDSTSAMRCDRLASITAKAVVTMKDGNVRCLVAGDGAQDLDRSCL